MAGMFPTRMRYSGVSFGYQLAATAAGSPAPLIAVRPLETYKSAVPIAWYLAVTAAVSAVAAGRPSRYVCRPLRTAMMHERCARGPAFVFT